MKLGGFGGKAYKTTEKQTPSAQPRGAGEQKFRR